MDKQGSTATVTAPNDAELDRRGRRYLAAFVGFLASAVVALTGFGLDAAKPHDHFSQITLNGDKRWYRNYAHVFTREMQDRDVLFHGIGASIKNAKKADIILLGHSSLQFAIVDDLVRAFERKHDVRLYNLTNPGIASGEYIRRLIMKWKLRPKIWVINADDTPANFFNPQMDDFFSKGRNSVFKVVESDWLDAFGYVIHRNIKWRLELAVSEFGPRFLQRPPYPFVARPATTFRNVETGNFNLDETNGFIGEGKIIEEGIENPCFASDQEAAWARKYLDGIGGTPLFILTPYDGWCRQRVSELAEAIGVETMLTPLGAIFTALDGRHMNRAGAAAYTSFLLDALERSRAFRVLKGLPVEDTPSVKKNPQAPLKICVSNKDQARLFVSIRSSLGVSDHALDPGAVVQLETQNGAIVCSSANPFTQHYCPNRSLASVWPCD